MNTNDVILWTCLAGCLGLTIVGLHQYLSRFQNRHTSSYNHMLYYMVLIYTYGYYSLWAGLLFNRYGVSTEITFLSRAIHLMGSPFLLISHIFFISWIKSLLEIKLRSIWLYMIYGLALATLLVISLLNNSGIDAIKFLYQGMGLFIGLLAPIAFAIKKPNRQRNQDIVLMSTLLIVCSIYYFTQIRPSFLEIADPIAIFFFFSSQTAFLVHFVRSFQFQPANAQNIRSIDQFIIDHKITKREREVVHEILKGKSNQQIADTLYITEQTVKDHVSRIYVKTNMKSRAQLISILK